MKQNRKTLRMHPGESQLNVLMLHGRGVTQFTSTLACVPLTRGHFVAADALR